MPKSTLPTPRSQGSPGPQLLRLWGTSGGNRLIHGLSSALLPETQPGSLAFNTPRQGRPLSHTSYSHGGWGGSPL